LFKQNLEKFSDIKPNENPTSWSRDIPYFRTYSLDAPKIKSKNFHIELSIKNDDFGS